ncbi:MAG: hypothetical protein IJR87_00170 [Bacteroidaceae bacterium]|nr:hypothetical protein [Bacteroidaceae bacterium]
MKQTIRTSLAALMMAAVSAVAMGQTAVKATFVSGSDAKTRESADKVADGRKSTKWCMDDPGQLPYFVVLSVGEQPVALQEYVFTTGDDTNMYPDRNPCSWVVYGSNDQKQWKVVAEEHCNLRMGPLNEQDYYFPTKSQTPYRFFKFVFQEVQEDTRIQLSEIQLIKAGK